MYMYMFRIECTYTCTSSYFNSFITFIHVPIMNVYMCTCTCSVSNYKNQILIGISSYLLHNIRTSVNVIKLYNYILYCTYMYMYWYIIMYINDQIEISLPLVYPLFPPLSHCHFLNSFLSSSLVLSLSINLSFLYLVHHP